MKKLLLLFILIFSLSSCVNTQKDQTQTLSGVIDNETTQVTDTGTSEKKDLITFIGFVSTTCEHCKNEMPIYEDFYKKYSSKINMQLINTNGLKFDGYTIPQDNSKQATYESLTNEPCDLIPSYIIYRDKEIIQKECGKSLTYMELEQKLLLNNQIDMKTTVKVDQNAKLANGDIVAIMKTTNGTIKIKLFQEAAPKTVNNFIALAKKGYYNGLIFHRIIKDFMIQGGDPTGTGMGGESIYGASFEDEFNPNLTNIKGSISMANSGPNTNGSQFFINQANNSYLNNKHSVFGQVVEGLDNVDAIAKVKTGRNDKPEKDVKIITLEIKKFDKGSYKDFDFDINSELKKVEAEKKQKDEANKTRTAKSGDKVKVQYTLTSEAGVKIDSSRDRGQAFEFTIGAGQTIVGFDKGVTGMKIGEKKSIKLEPKEAYGEYDKVNVEVVNKSELVSFEQAGIKLEKGSELPTQMGNLKIIDSTKDTVTVDLNHELAGKVLLFDIELVSFSN